MTNQPSIDPANVGDLTGAFKHIFSKMQQRMDGMLPAKIIAFDRTTNLATVQPLIKLLTTGGFVVGRAQLASIPVVQVGGGGFVMNCPFNPGDLGWIKSNDRDISLFLQSWQESQPNTLRTFSFSDGVFIPDVMKGWTIASADSASAVLQNLSGTVKIALSDNKVTITAPNIEMNGITTINGALSVVGDISSTTSITAPLVTGSTNVVFGTVSGTAHVHSGVTTGTSNTGAPV